MAIDFAGQTAIVTGAGQGLGRAYALELAARGANVIVNDIADAGKSGASAADIVVAEILSTGGKAASCLADVGTEAGGEAIVAFALDHFGGVDAIVHNAGTWRNVPFADMRAEQLDPVLDVHLRGAFFVIRPAWPIMREKGYGRIVLTGSGSGLFGRENGSNYAAAKAAMIGLARALYHEGRGHGIMANVILPLAPFANAGKPVPEAMVQQLAKTGISEADGGAQMVVPMLAYLASAACTVNGEAFSAGGGRFARIFTGVADGWMPPEKATPTAEDIDENIGQIRDLDRYSTPDSVWDELKGIGELRRR